MLPVVDLRDPAAEAAGAIDDACRRDGFFYVVGHGVDPALAERVDAAARAFFARPEDEKAAIAMARGGRAWRGWFPLGGELTSGVPDGKEGLYFGAELGPDHPRVAAGTPLHGANLFPASPPDLRGTVLAWLDAMTALGHRLASLAAAGLGLDPGWFAAHLTGDPTILFRIFRYPPSPPGVGGWGVAEHTDYGLLTILRQDDAGGLEVRTTDGWVDAPPVPGSFVVNIGDMLDRMTGGRYRSTPHRVRNTSGGDRVSLAFFFDPSWDAEVVPLPIAGDISADDAATRWDGASLRAWQGTYGEYLLAKVAKVFPELAAGCAGTEA
ncbi:MAG TPA: 2OG-Fe(II) oxygenase family protein [Acidimicrobiales bacterium]|nr:2OG-Fe(II) oxygenase family protein [Acidimicrobiales bacterium]